MYKKFKKIVLAQVTRSESLVLLEQPFKEIIRHKILVQTL